MNERKSKNIVIIALCITLIFMGVGFSILSQTLTINGSASIDADSNWKVYIDSITPVDAVYAGTQVTTNLATLYGGALDNGAIADNTNGGIDFSGNEAITGTFKVNFNQPGDYVVYKVVTGNHGTIDAKLVQALSSDANVTTGIGYTADPSYTAQQDASEGKVFSYAFGTFDETTKAWSNQTLTPASYTLPVGSNLANGSGNTFYIKVMYNDTTVNPASLTSEQKTATATITFVYEQTTNS